MSLSKSGIINLELKAGDILFFNHLLPHVPLLITVHLTEKHGFLTYKNIDDLDEERKR